MNEITKGIIGHLTEEREYSGFPATDSGYLRILNRSNINTLPDGDELLTAARDEFIERVNHSTNPDEAWRGIAYNLGYGPDNDDLNDFIVDFTQEFIGSSVIYYDDTARYFAGTRAWEWEQNCEDLLGGESIISQMQIVLFAVIQVFLWAITEELQEQFGGAEYDNEVAAEAAAQEG